MSGKFPRFDEIWIGPQQLAMLGGLAQSTSHLEGEVLEIGCWQGLSTVSLANAVHPATLHVVDHWRGDDADAVAAGTAIRPELVERDNYQIFLDNMSILTQGNFQVWKMDWREFAAQWDKPIRFLHLDASHTTKAVSDNLAALLPYAVPGTIFAGDDWDWPTVQAGIWEHFTPEEVNTQLNKLWWVQLDGPRFPVTT